MNKWFNEQSKVVRIVLLVIPGINWIVEILLRWELFINAKEENKVADLIRALIVTFGFGTPTGWVDCVWTILNDKITHANE